MPIIGTCFTDGRDNQTQVHTLRVSGINTYALSSNCRMGVRARFVLFKLQSILLYFPKSASNTIYRKRPFARSLGTTLLPWLVDTFQRMSTSFHAVESPLTNSYSS
jgi:hypothetical protein